MAGRKKDEVLRTGKVTMEKGGKVYTAQYDVLKAGRRRVVVRLETGQSTNLAGFTEKGLPASCSERLSPRGWQTEQA